MTAPATETYLVAGMFRRFSACCAWSHCSASLSHSLSISNSFFLLLRPPSGVALFVRRFLFIPTCCVCGFDFVSSINVPYFFRSPFWPSIAVSVVAKTGGLYTTYD